MARKLFFLVILLWISWSSRLLVILFKKKVKPKSFKWKCPLFGQTEFFACCQGVFCLYIFKQTRLLFADCKHKQINCISSMYLTVIWDICFDLCYLTSASTVATFAIVYPAIWRMCELNNLFQWMMKLFLVFFLTISTTTASMPVGVPELASNSGSKPIEEAKTSDEAKGEFCWSKNRLFCVDSKGLLKYRSFHKDFQWTNLLKMR